MPPTTTPRGPVHELLHQDHQRLAALFDEVINAAEANVDSVTLGALWTRFDNELRAHFAAEEELVFDKVQSRHPGKIAALRATHDEIRARLREMDIEVDLHVIRAPAVQALIDLLRAHAAEEDAGLYAWAEEEDAGRGLLDRLTARLRR
jgi:hemerythrin